MMRLHGWESRIIDWASTTEGKSFLWGELDCMQLGIQALESMYGEEIRARLKVPAYGTPREALHVLSAFGNIPSAYDSLLQAWKVPAQYGHHGDLVLVEGGDLPWSTFVWVSDHLLGIRENSTVQRWAPALLQVQEWGASATVMRFPNG